MTDTNPTDNNSTPGDNPFVDQLSKIVNEEGKPKYETVEAALEALEHSQQHIKNLEAEAATKTELFKETVLELEKRKSVEEVVKGLTQQQAAPPKAEDPPEVVGLSEEKAINLIKNALKERETVSLKVENQNKVMASLNEKFGEEAPKAIQKVLKDVGMSADDLQNLSQDNPNLVIKLFDTVKTDATTTLVKPSPTGLPATNPQELKPPVKRLLTTGAPKEDLLEEWRNIRNDVYKKNDIAV